MTLAGKILSQYYPELLLLLFCFIFLHYRHKNNRKPHIPVNWPVFGMIPGLLNRFGNIYTWTVQVQHEVGCTFPFHGPWLTKMDFLITSDPANVQHIFSINFPNYPKGEELAEIMDILGNGIFTADEDSWREQRAKAHRLISDKTFRSFAASSIISKVETGLVPLLDDVAKKGVVVDLQDVLLRLTFDTTCNLVFGVDPNGLSADFPTIPFAKAMDDAMGALFLRHIIPPPLWKLMKWLRVGPERKLAMAWVVIDDFIAEKIAAKKLSSFHKGEDLLSSYIDEDLLGAKMARTDSEEHEKFLRDTAISFMLAGRDTTGAGLTWFFWLLSQNPRVEEKILDELKRKSEDVGRLVYLQAALREALRLFPPVPFEHKQVAHSDELPSGHKVQSGLKIIVNLYGMARCEGVWGNDCGEFKPERWIWEKGRLKYEQSCKFLSFNSGPRSCLGKDVAFTQMEAVAAAIVRNFQVEVVEGHAVEPKLSIILQMKNGLKVRIRKRIGF